MAAYQECPLSDSERERLAMMEALGVGSEHEDCPCFGIYISQEKPVGKVEYIDNRCHAICGLTPNKWKIWRRAL